MLPSRVAAHKTAHARRVDESLFASVLRFVPSLGRRGLMVEDTMREPIVDVGIPRPTGDRSTSREAARVGSRANPDLVAAHASRSTAPRARAIRRDARAVSIRSACESRLHGSGRSAHHRTRREPFRPVTHGTSPCSTMTIVGIRAFSPAECRFLNRTRHAGSSFRTAITSEQAGDLVYRYTANLREGLQPRRTFLCTLYRPNVIAAPTVLTRRSAYDAVGPAFSEPLLFDDWEMWLRTCGLAFPDAGFLDVYDADYRIHASQSSHDGLRRMGEHRLGLLDEVDRWYRRCSGDRQEESEVGGPLPALRTMRYCEESGADQRHNSLKRVPELPFRGAGSGGGTSGLRGTTVSSAATRLVEGPARAKRSGLVSTGVTRSATSSFRAGDLVEVRSREPRSSPRSTSTAGSKGFHSCRRCCSSVAVASEFRAERTRRVTRSSLLVSGGWRTQCT